ISLQADSNCVHRDRPGAENIARNLKDRLHDAGITVRAFTRR
ncbi:LamB/YcsF family protein, partial [Pseudomonas syringae pv. tagetis]